MYNCLLVFHIGLLRVASSMTARVKTQTDGRTFGATQLLEYDHRAYIRKLLGGAGSERASVFQAIPA